MIDAARGDDADLVLEYVDPASLVAADYNPRTITPEAMAGLMASIAGNGFRQPLLARTEDRLLIGGHQRRDAAIRLGLSRVPVTFVAGISDERAKALNIALNNPEIMGDFDDAKLAALMSEFTGPDMRALTGYDEAAITEMITHARGGDDTGTGMALGGVEYQLVVHCGDEHAQAALCEEMESRGLKCRLLTL